MAFNGKEGEFIPLLEAESETSAFRSSGISTINGYFLGRQKIQELLAQTDAQGLRIYFTKKQGELNLVVVAANSNEEDITAKALNSGKPCPPICKKSVLNS